MNKGLDWHTSVLPQQTRSLCYRTMTSEDRSDYPACSVWPSPLIADDSQKSCHSLEGSHRYTGKSPEVYWEKKKIF